jgi:hypothetical protein
MPGAEHVAAANPRPIFPLKAHSSGRYLVTPTDEPFRVHGEQCWISPTMLNAADFQAQITALAAQGVNTVTLMAICHDYEEHTGRTAGTGPQASDGTWPFLKDTTGATYAGTGVTPPVNGGTSLATIWADMSTTNDNYFANIDRCLNVCLAAGMLVNFFPAYMGYQGKIEGFAADKFHSGSTKCHTYGQYMGNRYKGFPNIIWMLGGDFDPSTWNSTYAGLVTCEEQLAQGIRDGGATQLIGGHFPFNNGLATDISATSSALAALIGVNTIYVWQHTNTDPSFYLDGVAAWQFSPATPTFVMDPTGNYENGGATLAQVREYGWWGCLSTIGGSCYGNDPVWYSGSTTFASINTSGGLLSVGHTHRTYLAQFFNRILWWRLLPASQAGMGAIITAGQGTASSTAWIQAAKDPSGNVLVAYVPPAWANGSFTVDTSSMPGKIAGQWYDPTNGTYQATSGSPYTATSSISFTPPGTNSGGQTDWVLLLNGGSR